MHESTLKVVGHFACWSHCARARARLRHERAAGNPSAEYSHGTMLIVKKLGELNHENIR